jgi:hypothetical protein
MKLKMFTPPGNKRLYSFLQKRRMFGLSDNEKDAGRLALKSKGANASRGQSVPQRCNASSNLRFDRSVAGSVLVDDLLSS